MANQGRVSDFFSSQKRKFQAGSNVSQESKRRKLLPDAEGHAGDKLSSSPVVSEASKGPVPDVFTTPKQRVVQTANPTAAQRRSLFDRSSAQKSQSRKKPTAIRNKVASTRELFPSLPLPSRYGELARTFQGVDTIVSMLHNRPETCTFNKLQTNVQSFTRKRFDKKHLGQIKTVLPTAYVFKLEKGLPCSKKGESEYQLTISPCLGQDLKELQEEQKFTSTMLVERKKVFHQNLVQIVKDHHQDFLSGLKLPLSVPGAKLTRWHPKFPLGSVPDVTESPLPQPPPAKAFSTAQQVLSQVASPKGKPRLGCRRLPGAPPASPTVAAKPAGTERSPGAPPAPPAACGGPDQPQPEPTAFTATGAQASKLGQPVKKTGYQLLLDKIKAKESRKVEEMLTRDPEEEKRISMMQRLPQICRILRGFFLSERKAAIPIERVSQKVVDSYKSTMSVAVAEKHLRLLAEIVPDWLEVLKVRNVTYTKLKNKSLDIAQVDRTIEKLLNKH